jgi:hypothetical protein
MRQSLGSIDRRRTMRRISRAALHAAFLVLVIIAAYVAGALTAEAMCERGWLMFCPTVL